MLKSWFYKAGTFPHSYSWIYRVPPGRQRHSDASKHTLWPPFLRDRYHCPQSARPRTLSLKSRQCCRVISANQQAPTTASGFSFSPRLSSSPGSLPLRSLPGKWVPAPANTSNPYLKPLSSLLFLSLSMIIGLGYLYFSFLDDYQSMDGFFRTKSSYHNNSKHLRPPVMLQVLQTMVIW